MRWVTLALLLGWPTSVRAQELVGASDAPVVRVAGRSVAAPAYPPRVSSYHAPARLTSAAVDPSGRFVAVAGRCRGYSGVTPTRRPSCAAVFVRVIRVANGAVVRELALPWDLITDEQRTLALAFSTDGSMVGAYTRMAWSDCSYEGAGGELHVWRVSDGAHVSRRSMRRSGTWRDYTLKLSETHAAVRASYRGRVWERRVPLARR